MSFIGRAADRAWSFAAKHPETSLQVASVIAVGSLCYCGQDMQDSIVRVAGAAAAAYGTALAMGTYYATKSAGRSMQRFSLTLYGTAGLWGAAVFQGAGRYVSSIAAATYAIGTAYFHNDNE